MRLGLLSVARITTNAVVAPAAEVDGVELAAVAARDGARARAAADEWGIDVAHDGYEALIADPSIDAVYIATPAALHRRWAIAALEAGKHVLCEKPIGANADDARAMVAAADAADRILMEAFHWRYHPFVAQVEALLAAGAVGAIERVEGVFELPDGVIGRGDIRWDLALGGGALMDLGCYAVQWLRWIVGDEPQVVSATAQCPVPGIDGALRAELAWPSGVTGSMQCSMIAPAAGRVASLTVTGADGELVVANPLAPQNGDTSITVEARGATTRHEVDRSASYHHQLVAFADAVATGRQPVTSGDDIVATMACIDACYRAAGLQPRPTVVT